MPSLKLSIRSPSCTTLPDRDVQGGVSSCQVWVAHPYSPGRMSLLSPAKAAATCGFGAAPEAQQGFAVQPELLNCTRYFAATAQFVIKICHPD